MSKTNKEPVDLSWMWHCSCSSNPKRNVLDYSFFVDDNATASSLTIASEGGFRLALRKMEDLGLITMNDIDRKPNDSDQKKWDETFGDQE